MSKTNDFSQSLSTLFSWKRTKLSLSSLFKFKVFIKFSKMFSNIYEFYVDMYYIDSRYIVVSLFSVSEINKKMHFNMTNIVKSFFQLWHNNCWIFNIRICFSDFASYDDDHFIIFSNFVRFWNLSFDRIISFDRNRRLESRTKDRIILFVQRIWSLFAIDKKNSHDLILLKNDIVEFEFSIVERTSYMTIERIFEFVFQIFKIRRVYNRDFQKFRFVNQFRALRKKFEMKYYDRKTLVKKFHVNVLFLLFTCFIDDFDFYRNMYRNLCDIYFTSTTLNLKKRQRTRNLYSIIFKFHDSKFNDVMRLMTEKFSMLKKNCFLMINEKKKQIWTFILIFTNDMKSQQKIANFFDFNAKFFCRICYANEKIKNDINYDIIDNERYHHQTFYVRSRVKSMTKIFKEKFFDQYEMIFEFSTLQFLISILNIIVNRFENSTHNEFVDIVRKIISIFDKWIFISKVFELFIQRFRFFSFFFDWNRIQSFQTHLKSWFMNECAKTSIIIFVFLRCWSFQNSHIKSKYRAKFMKRCDAKWRFNDWIIYYLTKMTKSNNFVASFCIIMHDRVNLQIHVLNARKKFQLLMKVEKHFQNQIDFKQKTSKTKKANKIQFKKTIVIKKQRAFSIFDVVFQINEITIQTNEMSEKNQSTATFELFQIIDVKMIAFSNVHVAFHFFSMIFEYEILWVMNAFSNEKMHK